MEENIVNEIFEFLCDRGGFDDWWYGIDESIQSEIKDEIVKIITKN